MFINHDLFLVILFLLLVAMLYISYRFGNRFPKLGCVLAVMTLGLTCYLWSFIFLYKIDPITDIGDGPGYAFGLIIAGISSIFSFLISVAILIGVVVSKYNSPNTSFKRNA